MFGVRPGPGLRIALEDPMRADTLFLERTAIEVDPRVKLIAADIFDGRKYALKTLSI